MTGETERQFIESYERERAALPGAELGWLAARREAALAAFASAGLPHRRLEDWRYTDLRQALTKAAFAPAPTHRGAVVLPDAAMRPSVAAFDAIERHVMVFVNGVFRAEMSRLADLPVSVEIAPLSGAIGREWVREMLDAKDAEAPQAAGIVSLNTALMRDGAAIRVGAGAKLDKPLHLLFIAADGGASHTRNLVRLEEGAEAAIFETHLDTGGQASFADIVTLVSLAPRARLAHVKLQDEAREAVHLSSLSAVIEAEAELSSFTLTLGAGLSRTQNFIRFTGEGGKASVDGATALRGRQHGDQFCVIDHAVPGCRSSTLFKTVLDDEATGVFQGRVIVRPDAQKTDGRQMTNALLLSRRAAMNAKPELEIYADDVQCAHGSTIGELNAEALFYLRARGIDEPTARQLLISAFLDGAFVNMPHEGAREALKALVAEWFRAGRKEAA